MRPLPDDRAKFYVDETDFFVQLALNCLFPRLAGFDAAAWCRPKCPIRELKMHEEYALLSVQYDRSNSLAQRQRHNLKATRRQN